MTNNGNTNFNHTNSSIADGVYTLRAYCNDTLGNTNYSSSVSFQIDNTKPLISYGTGTESNNSFKSQTNVYVNVSVTELNEGTITFLLYNSTSQVNSSSYTDLRRTINWTGLSAGVYYYNVSVNDSVGNSNSTETRTITLDTTLPAISVVYPTNTSYAINVSALNYTASDTNL